MSKFKFPRLLGNRVLISPDKPEEVSAGGIIIPNDSREQQNKGLILAIGPGCSEEVTIGKIACYGEYAGEDFEYKGITYLLMRETDILYVKY
jgi:chaperonin GroES